MKKWIRVLPVLGAAVLLAAGLGHQTAQAQKKENSVIADRIFIGDVSVGGMTKEEAVNAVQKYVDNLADQVMKLTINDVSVDATAEELGVSWKDQESVDEAVAYGKSGNLIARYKAGKDLEHEDKVFNLPLTVDTEKTTSYLEEHASELNRDAVDFGLKRENGSFQVIEGQDGIVVDVAKSVDTIDKSLQDGWKENNTVELAAEISKPKGSEEELAKVKDVLGTFTTNYASSASGRKANIANGSKKINGSVIYPGEEFSVYHTVAPFNADNGYKLAGAYENGTTVDAYGGGICQVSTTLYNAVIRAELEVTERSGHSMIVNYVDPSADAAIAGEYKDFKFKNNTEAPIYIEGYASGSNVSFTIYGQETRPSNRKVSFVSETLSTTDPGVKFEASADAVGTITKTQGSHEGKSARLWKIVTVDGVEQSRDVFNKTTYKASPKIFAVGTSSANPEATAAMKAAIATQDEGTIRAAAAQWKNAVQQPEQPADPNAAQTQPTDGTTQNNQADNTAQPDQSQQGTDAAQTQDQAAGQQ